MGRGAPTRHLKAANKTFSSRNRLDLGEAKEGPIDTSKHHRLLLKLLVMPQFNVKAVFLKTPFTYVIKHGQIELKFSSKLHICLLRFMVLEDTLNTTRREK